MYQQVFELHASVLKALAHPKRLEIIHLLRDQELCVSDIYSMLDLPQANISQHLMVLRDAGVVNTRKQGKQIYYKLSHPNWITASDLVRDILISQHPDIDKTVFEKIDELVPLVRDPVCDMRLSPKTAGFHTKYKNTPYYFCASGCLKAFTDHPEAYV